MLALERNADHGKPKRRWQRALHRSLARRSSLIRPWRRTSRCPPASAWTRYRGARRGYAERSASALARAILQMHAPTMPPRARPPLASRDHELLRSSLLNGLFIQLSIETDSERKSSSIPGPSIGNRHYMDCLPLRRRQNSAQDCGPACARPSPTAL